MKKFLIGMAVAACFLAGCKGTATVGTTTDSTSVQAEKNRLAALKSMQYFADKKIDSLFAICAADFVDYGNGEDKPMKNRDSIKTMLNAFFTAFPDYKETNINSFARGDSAIV